MKNKNFDSISKFSVPQSWIDNAKNVPLTTSRKSPFVLFVTKYNKILSAAAVFVFVLTLSIIILVMSGQKPPVAPFKNIGNDAVTPTINNGSSTSFDGTDYTNPDNTGDSGDHHEHSSDNSSDIGNGNNHNPQRPNKPTDPSEKPTGENPSSDNPSSDEPSSEEPPSDPVPPISSEEPSSEEPSSEEPPSDEPPWVEPSWEEPSSSEEEPTSEEPSSEEPSMPDYSDDVLVSTVTINKDELNGANIIYCKVINPYDITCGNPNLFASEHVASIIYNQNSTVTLHYEVKRMRVGIYNSYRFIFYDSSGKTIKETTNYYIY